MEPTRQGKRRKGGQGTCDCCRKDFPLCWKCRCGFSICQACMNENSWGMTCNGITWECPDCGGSNSY